MGRRPLTEVRGGTNENDMIVQQQQQAGKKTGMTSPLSESPTKKLVKTSSVEVQTENGDHSVVTADEAPMEYWKTLATARQEALEITLQENYELHQRIKDLEEEKTLLEKIVEQAKRFSELLEDFSDEEDPDESGIGLRLTENKEADDSILEK